MRRRWRAQGIKPVYLSAVSSSSSQMMVREKKMSRSSLDGGVKSRATVILQTDILHNKNFKNFLDHSGDNIWNLEHSSMRIMSDML